MPKVTLRNVNAIGYTDLPEIGRTGPSHDEDGNLTEPGSGCLMPGETFEVDSDLAEKLLELVGTFELADPADGLGGMKVAELKAHALDHGIDLGDATTKPAILAAIRKG